MFPPFMESADVLSIAAPSRMSSDSVKKFESVLINLYECACEALAARPSTPCRGRDRQDGNCTGNPLRAKDFRPSRPPHDGWDDGCRAGFPRCMAACPLRLLPALLCVGRQHLGERFRHPSSSSRAIHRYGPASRLARYRIDEACRWWVPSARLHRSTVTEAILACAIRSSRRALRSETAGVSVSTTSSLGSSLLIGGNVADKGNSRAALRSVADSVHATLRSALGVRGGLGEAPRGKAHDPKRFAARLHFESEDSTLCFSFSVVSGENEASVYYARIAR